MQDYFASHFALQCACPRSLWFWKIVIPHLDFVKVALRIIGKEDPVRCYVMQGGNINNPLGIITLYVGTLLLYGVEDFLVALKGDCGGCLFIIFLSLLLLGITLLPLQELAISLPRAYFSAVIAFPTSPWLWSCLALLSILGSPPTLGSSPPFSGISMRKRSTRPDARRRVSSLSRLLLTIVMVIFPSGTELFTVTTRVS